MTKQMKYGRKKSNWINSTKLKRYRDDNKLATSSLATLLLEKDKDVQNWINRKRMPKTVFNRLNQLINGPQHPNCRSAPFPALPLKETTPIERLTRATQLRNMEWLMKTDSQRGFMIHIFMRSSAFKPVTQFMAYHESLDTLINQALGVIK